jgi:ribonuclease P protein component
MLPTKNRLRTSKDFALTTKTGVRATSLSLVVYLQTNLNTLNDPQVGLIVNKSVGGSVVRHRVSRQIRHLISGHLKDFPKNSQIVIRVLRNQPNFEAELNDLIPKVIAKSLVSA